MRCCIHQTWWGNASLGPVYYYYYNRVHPPVTTSTRRPFSKDWLTRFSALFDLWLKFRLYSLLPCRRSSYLSVHQVLNGERRVSSVIWCTDANPPGKDEKEKKSNEYLVSQIYSVGWIGAGEQQASRENLTRFTERNGDEPVKYIYSRMRWFE